MARAGLQVPSALQDMAQVAHSDRLPDADRERIEAALHTRAAAGAADQASTPSPAKRARTDPVDPERASLERYSQRTLKAMLQANDQLTSGTKQELVDRILECQRSGGGIPMCPMCRKAHLRLEVAPLGERRYVCPGYFDNRKYRACPFRAAADSVARLPWKELSGTAAAAAAYELKQV